MSMAENAGRFATIVCGTVERLKLPKMSVRIVLKQVQSGLRNISQPKLHPKFMKAKQDSVPKSP